MGDSCSNSLAETINGLYEAELIHRRSPWKTRAAAPLASLEWVAWFNNHRLLEPLGYIPPAEASGKRLAATCQSFFPAPAQGIKPKVSIRLGSPSKTRGGSAAVRLAMHGACSGGHRVAFFQVTAFFC
jgi:hypothetical protein